MTPAHRLARAGKMTASKAPVVMGGLDTIGLKAYVMDLAWERVYGLPEEEGFTNAAMERGTLLEPMARDWYAFATDFVVDHDPDRTIDHPMVPMAAASPDGLLPDRVLEIKCPMHKAWMEVLSTGKVPAEYRHQLRWQMWVTGRRLCDFVCWHPLAGGLIVPFTVTDAEIDAMTTRAFLVNEMVNEWVDRLQSRREAA